MINKISQKGKTYIENKIQIEINNILIKISFAFFIFTLHVLTTYVI